jgi:LPXTG-site transpeptidase (sortase) family protein
MARPAAPRLLRLLSALLICAGIGLLFLFLRPPPQAAAPGGLGTSAPESAFEPAVSLLPAPQKVPSSPESGPPAPEPYPTDKLFVTAERLNYRDGDLVLRVPRLGLTSPIVGAIDPQTRQKFASGTMTAEEKQAFYANDNSAELLTRGVMLFNLSPLPDEVNANVSLSGHRDIYGCEFYYIHTIAEGDLLYLEYNGRQFCYEYLETTIVDSDDWSPIYCKDFPCLTLISCDPIGTSRNRIVVTARLIGVDALPDAADPSGS